MHPIPLNGMSFPVSNFGMRSYHIWAWFKRGNTISTQRHGKQVESWTYTLPDSTDDHWTVASLEEVHIQKTALNSLFQKILDGDFQGLDAILVAREGKLVLEEYFHFGSRDETHTIP